MNHKRPVNLDLTTVKFPVTAISSILHRNTGVLLFFAFPIMLCTLDSSLRSEGSFDRLLVDLQAPIFRLAVWLVLVSLAYHIIAGVRHLLMDLHIGESYQGGKTGAWIVLIVSAVFAVLAGVWLW